LEIQKAIQKVECLGLRSDNKIACIKAFRECFVDEANRSTVSLVDSKGIIENWDAFKAYALKYQKLPTNFYDYNARNGGIPN